MHVLFDARLLHRSLSGLERVQRNVLRELGARDEITRLRAAVLTGTRIPDGLPARIEWLEVDGTEDLLRCLLAEGAEGPDVYHLSWFPDHHPRDLWLPYAARSAVVEVHDAILNRHPEYHGSPAKHAWYHAFIRALVASGDRLLVHSESGRREAIDDLGADPARIDVAPLAIDPSLAVPLPESELRARLAKLGLHGDWFVMVGKDYPHKDHGTAFRALARVRQAGADVHIVCAGSKVWHAPGATSDGLLAELGVAAHVRWVQELDDDDMKALVQGARALLYPSREEGFGLPPIEAMALGTPALCSAAMSIPEVCGHGAWLFPTGDDAALSRRMLAVLRGGHQVHELIERGRARAATFSWQRCADDVLRCYAAARKRTRPKLDTISRGTLRLIADAPWSEAREISALRQHVHELGRQRDDVVRQLHDVVRQLHDLQRAQGLALTQVDVPSAKRPRWSLKRRIEKIRRRLRGT